MDFHTTHTIENKRETEKQIESKRQTDLLTPKLYVKYQLSFYQSIFSSNGYFLVT